MAIAFMSHGKTPLAAISMVFCWPHRALTNENPTNSPIYSVLAGFPSHTSTQILALSKGNTQYIELSRSGSVDPLLFPRGEEVVKEQISWTSFACFNPCTYPGANNVRGSHYLKPSCLSPYSSAAEIICYRSYRQTFKRPWGHLHVIKNSLKVYEAICRACQADLAVKFPSWLMQTSGRGCATRGRVFSTSLAGSAKFKNAGSRSSSVQQFFQAHVTHYHHGTALG